MLFIFDMGGVVTSTFNLDALYDELKITKNQFFEICNHNCGKTKKDIWDDFQAGRINTKEFWKSFNKRSKKYGVKPVNNDLFRLFFHPVLNEQTVEFINKLKQKHRVVCGTNTIDSHWENHMERGDYAFFHQTYASNKIGEVKPDTAFYEMIMKAEGYTPEQTFFTDDRSDNIESARSLGINAVQFTSAEELSKLWSIYC